jgi:preprotein translocase subunit SecY
MRYFTNVFLVVAGSMFILYLGALMTACLEWHELDE